MLLAFFVMDVIKINVEIRKVWFGQIAEVVRKISGKDEDDELDEDREPGALASPEGPSTQERETHNLTQTYLTGHGESIV